MIHRVVLDSIERFIGVITEHFAGAFPLWLSPTQIKILPIADRHHEKAYELKEKFEKNGLRVEVDDRAEKIGYKIREAQLKKTPFMLVVGDKEVESGEISVRKRGEGDLGSMGVEEFLAKVLEEIETKAR